MITTDRAQVVKEMLAMDGEALTVTEVALKLRISKGHVYALIKGGQLDAIKVGRCYRIWDNVLSAYLRGAAVEPDSALVYARETRDAPARM